MRMRLLALSLAASLAVGTAAAQQSTPSPDPSAPAPAAGQTAAPAETAPAGDLPVSLDRIREGLAKPPQGTALKHLDIKPENLLILGDHIKVADFGLVKELTSRTQNSMVAGLTPATSRNTRRCWRN